MTTLSTERHTRELPADLITPVGAYLRLREALGAPAFLLESVERGEQVGRYSFLAAGLDAVETLEQAAAFAASRPGPDRGAPPFAGGAVGFLSYDWVAELEPVPLPPANGADAGLPVMRFVCAETVVAFDHVRRTVTVTGARVDVDRAVDALGASLAVPTAEPLAPGEAVAEMTREGYTAAVARAKEHIAAGDAFQIVPSQRVRRSTAATPAAIYRALRAINPSPYMFLLDMGDYQLIGSSPETHVRLDLDGTCELRPIAGTRPRGGGPDADDALAAELLASEKERAEHVMLVDLARNDLGRVCLPGSVRVERFMDVERYSHVMHLVSRVFGQIAPGRDAPALLRATFPAGTVSGAPKVRAMQIISELEGRRRGAYAGAVGWLGYGGDMDTCIAIRTIVLRDGVAYIQSGGGIVADSDPDEEYHEAMNKVAALGTAIDRAETGVYGR
ncbi:MAG TPA: anthranilate synthase component I family protein [Gaiellales bacterium]|jgi:anthranilate synthase component 1|nr:anthranilate synthase component I family protein [Gaiellales bacterium]